jgi:hypothetical protein
MPKVLLAFTEAGSLVMELNERDRRIADAVRAALKALSDLVLDGKLDAAEAISCWVQLELASWERAQDLLVH